MVFSPEAGFPESFDTSNTGDLPAPKRRDIRPDVTFGEMLGAALVRDNIVGSALEIITGEFPEPFKVNPGYIANIEGYEEQWEAFLRVDSVKDELLVKDRIDRSRGRGELLANGGATAVWAQIVSGALSPINLAPIGFVGGRALQAARAAGKGSLLRGGTAVAKASALGMTVEEAALSITQLDRTKTETGFNIAGAIVIGGLMGGAIESLGEASLRAAVRELGDPTIKDPIPVIAGGSGDAIGPPKVAVSASSEAPLHIPYDPGPAKMVNGQLLTAKHLALKKTHPYVEWMMDKINPSMAVDVRATLPVAPAIKRRLIKSATKFDSSQGGKLATGAVEIVETEGAKASGAPAGAAGRGTIKPISLEPEEALEELREEVRRLRKIKLKDAEAEGLVQPKDGSNPDARFPSVAAARSAAIAARDELVGGAKPVKGFAEGEAVEVVGIQGDKVTIRTEDGREATIFRSRLDEDPDAPITKAPGKGQTAETEAFGEVEVRATDTAEATVQDKWELMTANLAFSIRGGAEAFQRYRDRKLNLTGPTTKLPTVLRTGMAAVADVRNRRPWQEVLRADQQATLTFKQMREAAGHLAARNDGKGSEADDVFTFILKKHHPEALEMAQIYREELFSPFLEAMIKAKILPAGLDPITAPSYLTRVWDVNKLTDFGGEQRFLATAKKWLKEEHAELFEGDFGDAQLSAAASEIHSELTKRYPGVRAPFEFTITGSSGTKRRAFTVKDIEVEEFLERDIEVIARYYHRGIAPDIALAEVFGDVGMTRELGDPTKGTKGLLWKAYENQRSQIRAKVGDFAGITEEQGTRLLEANTKEFKGMHQRLTHMRDQIKGISGQPEVGNQHWSIRSMKLLRAWNHLALSGGFMISSLGDPARIIQVNGFARTLGPELQAMLRNPELRKMATKELNRAAVGLEMTIDPRASMMADILNDSGTATGLEGFILNVSQKSSMVNLLTPWNQLMKTWTGNVAMQRIMEAIDTVSTGAASAQRIGVDDITKLADVNIAGRDVETLAQLLNTHKRTTDGVSLPNTHMWEATEGISAADVVRVRELFRSAIKSEVDATIVTPGIGEAPMWLSKEYGKTIGQFRSFAIAATTRVAFAGIQERNMQQLNGAILSMAAGAMVYHLKNQLAGRESSDDPFKIALEAFDRSGMPGIGSDILQVMGKLGFGIDPLSRTAARSVVNTIAGASLGRVEDVITLTGALGSFVPDPRNGDMTDRDRHILFQAMYMHNHFIWRKGYEALEEKANEFFR